MPGRPSDGPHAPASTMNDGERQPALPTPGAGRHSPCPRPLSRRRLPIFRTAAAKLHGPASEASETTGVGPARGPDRRSAGIIFSPVLLHSPAPRLNDRETTSLGLMCGRWRTLVDAQREVAWGVTRRHREVRFFSTATIPLPSHGVNGRFPRRCQWRVQRVLMSVGCAA